MIGILSLQGDIREHKKMLHDLNHQTIEVKKQQDLKDIDGLIIPGGESTTIGKLLEKFNLSKPIIKLHEQGMPIYGSCAGAIVLAKTIKHSTQPKLGIMNIEIKRNDYGRQIDSFETNIKIEEETLNHAAFRGIFIRAPIITNIGADCQVLAEHNNHPILVRQNNLLVSTFHPELTKDSRIHKYFLSMITKPLTQQ
tara:strand:+ start:291 stop:878 length:588 start_codon:yes stop_codon:yes gene_type:complete